MSTTPASCPAVAETASEPMQLGSSTLTPQERERCVRGGYHVTSRHYHYNVMVQYNKTWYNISSFYEVFRDMFGKFVVVYLYSCIFKINAHARSFVVCSPKGCTPRLRNVSSMSGGFHILAIESVWPGWEWTRKRWQPCLCWWRNCSCSRASATFSPSSSRLSALQWYNFQLY